MKKILWKVLFLGGSFAHPEFTTSHHSFALNLFKVVQQEDTSRRNLLISPLSVYLSLALLYNGSAHATRDSIGEVLHTGDIDIANLNSSCKAALQQIPLEDERIQLGVASSIWCNRKKLEPEPAFESIADNFYYAAIQQADFTGRAAVGQVNRWIDQNTHHQVDAILDHTDPHDPLYLINAFYFRGNWYQPFDAGGMSPFHLTGGSVVQAPFMKQTAVMKMFSDTSFTMVELPYGNGRYYHLYVLIPTDEELSTRDFAGRLSPERLHYALEKMTDQYISLSLPRWECNYDPGDLRPVLSRMGMGAAFNQYDDADLSNLCKPDTRKVYLSKVLHKTCIHVSENGMDALPSVTPIDGSVLMEHPHQSARELHIDRPFVYFLLEKEWNLVLYAGTINDPTAVATAAPVEKPAPVRRPLSKRHRR